MKIQQTLMNVKQLNLQANHNKPKSKGLNKTGLKTPSVLLANRWFWNGCTLAKQLTLKKCVFCHCTDVLNKAKIGR